jgi:ABC-type nitrate/sulfonate/bicarbonate transport system substrate-binding protein
MRPLRNVEKSPLAPSFDCARGMLFQRGELKTELFSNGGFENVFSLVRIFVTSPFEKGGLRGICARSQPSVISLRRSHHIKDIVVALSFLFACFLAALPASAQTPRKIIIGVSNPDNVTFFPLYFARDAGYFREQGLEPQLIVMNSDLAVKALITGDVDYAASTASAAKAAALGFPVKIVVSFFNGTDFSLVSKPEIKAAGDLKGKIIAVSRFGSAADFDAREALRHPGLDPAKDVKIIPVGAGPNRLVSLLTGKVDAAIINVAESIRAQEQGMRVLISTGKFNRQTLTGLSTATSKIAQNRDEVKRVLRAVTRAIDDYKDRKDKIQPLLIKHTRIRPEHFDFVYQKNLEVLSPDGSLTEADVKAAYIDARKAAANPPSVEMANLFDLSPLREIQGK